MINVDFLRYEIRKFKKRLDFFNFFFSNDFILIFFSNSSKNDSISSQKQNSKKRKKVTTLKKLTTKKKQKKNEKFLILCNKLKRNNRYNMIRHYNHENFDAKIKKIFEKMNEKEKNYKKIKVKYKHLMSN